MLTIRPSPHSVSSRSSASKATSVQEKKKGLPSEIQWVLKAFSVTHRAQQAYSAPFGEKSRLSIVCPVFSGCSERLLGRNRDYQSSLELLSACTQEPNGDAILVLNGVAVSNLR